MYKIMSVLTLCAFLLISKSYSDTVITPLSNSKSKAANSSLPPISIPYTIDAAPSAIAIGNWIVYGIVDQSKNQVILNVSAYNNTKSVYTQTIACPDAGITFKSVTLTLKTSDANNITDSPNFLITIAADKAIYIQAYTLLYAYVINTNPKLSPTTKDLLPLFTPSQYLVKNVVTNITPIPQTSILTPRSPAPGSPGYAGPYKIYVAYLAASPSTPSNYLPYLYTNQSAPLASKNTTGFAVNANLSSNIFGGLPYANSSNSSLAMDILLTAKAGQSVFFDTVGIAYVTSDNSFRIILFNIDGQFYFTPFRTSNLFSGQVASNVSIKLLRDPDDFDVFFERVISREPFNYFDYLNYTDIDSFSLFSLISFVGTNNSFQVGVLDNSLTAVTTSTNGITINNNGLITFSSSSSTVTNPVITLNKSFIKSYFTAEGYAADKFAFVTAWTEFGSKTYANYSELTITGSGEGSIPLISFPSGSISRTLQNPANYPSAIIDNKGDSIVATIAPTGNLYLFATTFEAKGAFDFIYTGTGNSIDPTTPATFVYNALPNRFSVFTKGINNTLSRSVTTVYQEVPALKSTSALFKTTVFSNVAK